MFAQIIVPKIGSIPLADINGLNLEDFCAFFVLRAIKDGVGTLAARIAGQLIWQVESEDVLESP